jgi:threonine dehydrogenase-like Zn-dependent dehydrogenase
VLGIHERSGAFAEWLSLPAGNLHAVPDSVSDETAVFVEPVAACCRILEQIDLDHSMQVAVLGDGRMGLLVAQVLKTRTPQVTMYGRHEAKIKVARALGIDAGLDRQAEQRFDVVVDVTGRGSGLPRALELVRPRGIVVMKTTMHGAAPFESWPAVVNEVTLMGSRCGPFQPAIEMLASGAVRTGPLISDVKPLTDYSRAFEAARGSLKVLLDPAAG